MSTSDPRNPNRHSPQNVGPGGGFADVSRGVDPDGDLYDFKDTDPNDGVELADRVAASPNPEPDIYALHDSGEMPAPSFAERMDDDDLYEFKDDEAKDELVFNDDYVHKSRKDIYDLTGGGEAPAFSDKATRTDSARYQADPELLADTPETEFAAEAGAAWTAPADPMAERRQREPSERSAKPPSPSSQSIPSQAHLQAHHQAHHPAPSTGRHQGLPPPQGHGGVPGTGRLHTIPPAPGVPTQPPGARGTGRHQVLGPPRPGETGKLHPMPAPVSPTTPQPLARAQNPLAPGRPPLGGAPRGPTPSTHGAQASAPPPSPNPAAIPPAASPGRSGEPGTGRFTRRLQGLKTVGPGGASPPPPAMPPAMPPPMPASPQAPTAPPPSVAARPGSPAAGSAPLRRPPQARSPIAPTSDVAPRVPPGGVRRSTSSFKPKHVDRPRASSDDDDPPFLKK